MAFIFYWSSRSTTGIGGSGVERFILFKTLHLIEYAILGFLVIYPLSSIIPSTLISYLYAITDEIHQSFTPGRGPKFTDTLIDLGGILIGILIFKYIKKHFKKSKNKLH